MKKYENGKYEEMTAEEIKDLDGAKQEATTIPSLEDRLSALEAAMLENILGVRG